MATIAVAGVAAAAGVGAGSSFTALAALAAAQAAAAYIDSEVLFPAIFGSPGASDSARVNNVSVSNSEEGSGLRYNIGPQNRVSGSIIWMSEVQEWGDRVEGDSPLIGPTPSSKFYEYYADIAVAIGEGVISEIELIEADGQIIYDATRNPATDYTKCKFIRFYPGTLDQPPDPRIQRADGIASVPGYRGTAYIMIQQLYLNDYGVRVPTFTFTFRADQALSRAQALARILERAGFTEDQYDVSRVPGCLRGIGNTGPNPPGELIEVIQTAYDIDVKYVNGRLTFFPKGSGNVIRIDPQDLGSSPNDQTDEPGITFEDLSDSDVPHSVMVRHIDPANGFQPGAQIRRRPDKALDNNPDTFSAPLVLTASEATALANRRLWRFETERVAATFNLPPKYNYIQEGDTLQVPREDDVIVLRAVSVTTGANYQLEVRAVALETITFEDAELSFAAAPAPSSPNRRESVFQPFQDPFLFLMDIPAIIPGDNETVGIYYAVTIPIREFEWEGGSLLEQRTGEDFFQEVERYDTEGVTGRTQFQLEEGTSGGFYIDRDSQVEVFLYEGELFSIAEENMLSGANFALIGDEIVAFADAEFLGDNVYRLSNLIRGLRGTRNRMAGHVSGERFVLLSRQFLERLQLQNADVGQIKTYKAVNFAGDESLSNERNVEVSGASIRPMPPADIRGTRNANGDLVITWLDVTNTFDRILQTGGVSMMPTDSRYVVRIMNGPNTFFREQELAGNSYTYTSEMQTADGVSENVRVRIRRRGQLDTISEFSETIL